MDPGVLVRTDLRFDVSEDIKTPASCRSYIPRAKSHCYSAAIVFLSETEFLCNTALASWNFGRPG